jgi:peptidoglycan/xylan/chitin deacetylase (PgdA/CDA1 family)
MKRIITIFLCTVCLSANAFWGEHTDGITDNIKSPENTVYITLDLCGGGYDKALVDFLVSENVPATFFVTGAWIKKQSDDFAELSKNKLFKIENHGSKHKPASIDGKSIYGITGTQNEKELKAEIVDNADKIEKLTGTRPQWYRSGTAYYDDGAIKFINDNGFNIAGFAITADAGATLPSDKVRKNVLSAHDGDILLLHANKPKSGTRVGLEQGIRELKKRNVKFAPLP